MTLGQKIANLRKMRGMTQEELSEAVGVTRQTISKWELDTSTPDLEYLCKLCDLFGVTADYLIRPEPETVEATEPANSDVPPTSSPTPAPQPPTKKPLNTRPAGWVMLGLAGILLLVALVSLMTETQMPELLIFAGTAAVFALELLLIRRKPLFIVMWTAWGFYTVTMSFTTGSFFLLTATFPHTATGVSELGVSIALIVSILWVFYTIFCLGVTVGMILKHIRAKRIKS